MASIRRSDELGQRRNDGAVVVLGADGHAQAVGQAVGRHAAQDDAARLQELVGRGRVLAFLSSGKWMSTKLPTLGVTFSPSFSISAVTQGSQLLVVRDGELDVGAVLDRRDARCDAPGR